MRFLVSHESAIQVKVLVSLTKRFQPEGAGPKSVVFVVHFWIGGSPWYQYHGTILIKTAVPPVSSNVFDKCQLSFAIFVLHIQAALKKFTDSRFVAA
jgi:hypothetical protein